MKIWEMILIIKSTVTIQQCQKMFKTIQNVSSPMGGLPLLRQGEHLSSPLQAYVPAVSPTTSRLLSEYAIHYNEDTSIQANLIITLSLGSMETGHVISETVL